MRTIRIGSGRARAIASSPRGHVDWRWSVRIDPYTSAVGVEHSRTAAIAAAEKKIDRALASKIAKVNLVPKRDLN
jgi:hypothetical protein